MTTRPPTEVTIRTLAQNAATIVAQAAGGEVVTITDRGRPVAQLTALPVSRLGALVEAGRARPPLRDLSDLPSPAPGASLSEELENIRANREPERYWATDGTVAGLHPNDLSAPAFSWRSGRRARGSPGQAS